MNKISASILNIERSVFKSLLRYMFDDCFDIEEEFSKHSSCNVLLGATVDLECATGVVKNFIPGMDPSKLVGTWMIDVQRDYTWGIEWNMVDEAVKVEKVTETITVETWKPICENVKPCSNQQPQSEVCLPKQ